MVEFFFLLNKLFLFLTLNLLALPVIIIIRMIIPAWMIVLYSIILMVLPKRASNALIIVRNAILL